MADEGLFPSTMWTRVISARDGSDTAARQSMEALAKAYWKPLYVFIRQRGRGHDDAAEGVQGFFHHLLSRNFLDFVRPREGRFRTFLLSSLTRWLNDQHDRSTAAKRGAGAIPLSLEEMAEAGREPPAVGVSPEAEFDRQWAVLVYQRARDRLREECGREGKVALFDLVHASVQDGGQAETYAAFAERTGTTEAAVKKAAFTLRGRLGTLLRAEIRETVGADGDIDEEIRYLISLLRNGVNG